MGYQHLIRDCKEGLYSLFVPMYLISGDKEASHEEESARPGEGKED